MTVRQEVTRSGVRDPARRWARGGWKRATAWMMALVSLAIVLAACGSASPNAVKKSSNPYHLIHPGVLTVGMDLQFKPEMYLTHGKPAGYDVLLLNRLARTLHVKLNIENLTFTGLVPGLEAKKFDMVSVGLTATPQREKAVTFSRGYVPYAIILGVPSTSNIKATIAAFNKPSVTLTALLGSVDATLATKLFPKAHLQTFKTDTSAMLQVATHRATAVVVEQYLLLGFEKSNPHELKQESFKKPFTVYYGSYAVHKGNKALVGYLNNWLCKVQKNGFLGKAYKTTYGVPIPPMPKCP